MRVKFLASLFGVSLVTGSAYPQGGGEASLPVRLVTQYKMPAEVKGNFDHFGIDVKRNRLFATPEDYASVLVFDLSTGKILRRIDGIMKPHAVLYLPENDRLYVTDGGDGSVRIFKGEDYEPLAKYSS